MEKDQPGSTETSGEIVPAPLPAPAQAGGGALC